MNGDYQFTSESVTEGHSDKICDQIADDILDEVLKQDHQGRVACEVLTTRGLVLVAGEITFNGFLDIPGIVRNRIKEIGYTDPKLGFNWEESAVMVAVQHQSPDIAMGVDTGGAGDQGMMFGYACTETDVLMPVPIMYAHRLAKRLAEVRKQGLMPWLRPDGKTQVTMRYVNGKPTEVTCVVVSAQHNPGVGKETLKDEIINRVIFGAIPASLRLPSMRILINPTGNFVVGGPQGDTGVTGRKIISDTYGGFGQHGGGAFSGKDPTKVDRSAAYMARYLAKNIVAQSEDCTQCSIQIAYAIGERLPVSLCVMTTLGTGFDLALAETIRKNFDLSSKGIIDFLKLREPKYLATSCYGHFGRTEPEFTWEKVDKELWANLIK